MSDQERRQRLQIDVACDVCGRVRPVYPAVGSGYVTCVRCPRTGRVIPEVIAIQIEDYAQGVTRSPFGEAAKVSWSRRDRA